MVLDIFLGMIDYDDKKTMDNNVTDYIIYYCNP